MSGAGTLVCGWTSGGGWDGTQATPLQKADATQAKGDGLESGVMQVREAKDFLVQQTAEQAQVEGVPLSELERRMMYFTENEEMSEDPIALNEEFEAEYDTDEYEAKIHGLLHRAFARVKKENPATARQWKEAVGELSKGDHYLPVLWGEGILAANYPIERPPYDFSKLIGTALLVVSIVAGVAVAASRYGQTPMPVWLKGALIFVFVGSYIYVAVLPLVTKKSPPGLQRLVDRISRVWSKNGPQG